MLAVIAVGFEAYQVLAHAHCLSGRTLPPSHRSTLGFSAAILFDALCYLLACYCLHVAGARWELLLLPLFGHVFYWSLVVFFRPFYLRVHDYRMQSIYADGSFCRAKRIATIFDTSLHLLAVVLLARQLRATEIWCAGAVGVVGYLRVFRPLFFAVTTD